MRFAVRIPIASHRPHLAACASPTAAKPHAVPIAAISTMDAPLPISSNSFRASGFNRQIDSRELSGKARASIVTRQISPAAAKKITSKIVPTDRHDWFIRKTTDRLPLSCKPSNWSPFNVFLTLSRNSLTNASAKLRSDLGKFYERIIIVGIILILGVNGLYSRFWEQPKEKR